MYASFPTRNADVSSSIRWFARASSIILMVIWLVYFAVETTRPGFQFERYGVVQGALLAVVFAGYILGWAREYLGGLFAVAGTIAYSVFVLATAHVAAPGATLFAVPGILYLLANHYNGKRVEQLKL